MGYSTQYMLVVKGENINRKRLADKLFTIRAAQLNKSTSYYKDDLEFLRLSVDELFDVNLTGSGTYDKWTQDDAISDLKQVSATFPNVSLLLTAQGEDPEDRWYCFFYSGKSFQYTIETAFQWMAEILSISTDTFFNDFLVSNLQ